MRWKDTTSYSQGEKRGKVEPRTWEAKIGTVTVTVTKYLGYGDEWVAHCRPFFDKQPTCTEDLEEAKTIAVKAAYAMVVPYAKTAKLLEAEVAKPPKKNPGTWYERRFQKIEDQMEADVEALAQKYRKEVLIPLCREHQLEFRSGMGTHTFFTLAGDCLHDWHKTSWGSEVFGVLQLQPRRGDDFGNTISDVTEDDWKRK